MGKNVFELWEEQGEKLPFKVKRVNWTTQNIFILVEKIVIGKFPYGIAYGKSMEINQEGKEAVSDFQYHCKNGIVSCAGNYQWVLFEKNVLNSSGS